MVSRNQYKRTVVFDLDDTLYDEADYVTSGKLAVASLVRQLCGKDIFLQLANEQGDFLSTACRICGFANETKESLLWAYRLHRPTIQCRPGVMELWKRLASEGTPLCVITDGRFITQSLKIESLGIMPDRVFISETMGAEKPSPISFQALQVAFPSSEYIYVGDNPGKDFIAPHQLGWRTFGISPKLSNIHYRGGNSMVAQVDPQIWVMDFFQLTASLFPA